MNFRVKDISIKWQLMFICTSTGLTPFCHTKWSVHDSYQNSTYCGFLRPSEWYEPSAPITNTPKEIWDTEDLFNGL